MSASLTCENCGSAVLRCDNCGAPGSAFTTAVADLANALRSFMAFQNAGYLAGQPFEETYALLVKDARTLLREVQP